MFLRACLASAGALLIAAAVSFGSAEKRAGVESGEVLCADSGNDEVVRLDPKTGDTEVLSDDDRFESPGDLAFDGPNKLYVADYDAFGGLGGVFKVNAKTGETDVVSDDDQFLQPDGIAVAPNGKIWVTDLDAEGGALFRVDPKSGKTKLIASDDAMEDALGVIVPKNGKPIVSSPADPSIVRVDPDDGDQHVIADGDDGLEAQGGVSLFEGKLYSQTGSALQSVDVKTGKVKTPIPDLESDTYGNTIDRKGRLYVGTSDDVIRANLKNGEVDPVGEGFGFCEGLETVR